MEIQNGKRLANRVLSMPITFHGGLQTSVRAKLITELSKYLLYERQQLPSPFDFVKRDVKQLIAENAKQEQTRVISSRNKFGCKKSIEAVKHLEETFSELHQAFEYCPEIRQAVILLGATPFSPKEVYLIELPPLNPDADNLSAKASIQSMFRQLIIQDPLSRLKGIHPTNMVLLVQAPRDSRLSWFFPKPLYKLPSSGRQFHFQLQSNCGEGDRFLSKDCTVVDISGVEPFDLSACDTSQDIFSESVTESSLSSGSVCNDSDVELMQSSSSSSFSSNSQDVTPTNFCHNACDSSSKASTNSADYSPMQSDSSFAGSSSLCSKSDSLCSVSNTTSTGSMLGTTSGSSLSCNDGPRLTKSRSASSILMQGSVLSQAPVGSRRNQVCGDREQETSSGAYSWTDREFIWFQSPLIIKGYRNKISGKA